MKHLFIARYKSRQLVVEAETSYAAQTLAAKQFKAKKQYEVDVYRADEQFTVVITS